MKMSVKAKVANGLVICLLMPRAAETASQAIDAINDLDAFRADDAFDFTIRKSHMAVAQVDPEDDPSGGDPSACEGKGRGGADPSASAPAALVTAEDGTLDFFEVSATPKSGRDRYYRVVSTAPGEARPEPETLLFDASGCIPQTVTVYGQNDGADPSGGDPSGGGTDPVTGDPSGAIPFAIQIRDERNKIVQEIPGFNLNNDNYVGISVDIIGPRSLGLHDKNGVFTVFAANGDNKLLSGDLIIEPTGALEILKDNVAFTILDSTDPCGCQLEYDSNTGTLKFNTVNLKGGQTFMVTLPVLLTDDSLPKQKISVRFVNRDQTQQTDDDISVRTEVTESTRSSLR